MKISPRFIFFVALMLTAAPLWSAPKKQPEPKKPPVAEPSAPAYYAPAVTFEESHPHGLSINQGIYATEVFGRNYYFDLRYDFQYKPNFFFEGSLGFGSLSSRFWDSVATLQLFGSDRVHAYEFLVGYAYDIKSSDGALPFRAIPYLTAGVAGVDLGGESHFAGVIGFGNRIPLPGLFGVNRLSLRYDVRDHMFKQGYVDIEPFFTHNIILIVGVQYFL